MTMLIDAGSIATALAAIAAALTGLWRFLIRPTVDRVRVLLELIERQLEPNGGESMRDAVDRIEAELRQHIDHFDRYIDTHIRAARNDQERTDETDRS